MASRSVTSNPNMGRALAIVPAFNESGSIREVVRALKSLPQLDVLVVDDGSRDSTSTLASEAGADVVSLPTNLGIGAALKAGFIIADRRSYKAALQFDGDGQHGVESVSSLLSAALDHQADLVIGSRFRGAIPYSISRSRRLAIRLISLAIRGVTGLQLSDPTSGFRAFSPRAINLFAKSYPNDYMESVEAIVIAHRLGLKIIELPANMHPRQAGTPSASLPSAIWHTLRAVFAVYAAHLGPTYPPEKQGR